MVYAPGSFLRKSCTTYRWRCPPNFLCECPAINPQMCALNSALEAGLEATKISLEVMRTANSEAEAAAKRNALQADLNALRAEGNACWANAEGMRAEEAISRRYLADQATAKKVGETSTPGTPTCTPRLCRRKLGIQSFALPFHQTILRMTT